MQSKVILDAYANDPDADFHALVQEWCEGIPRRPAKTINFLVAFGGGEKLIVKKLSNDFRKMGKGYTNAEAERKAIDVFKRWHRMLPENKEVALAAENKCKQRGYVRNLAGRRLQIPGPRHNIWRDDKGRLISKCHNALPLATQSTAADIAKFLSVQIQPLLRTLGVKLAALVHDEFVFFAPDRGTDFILHCAARIKAALEVLPFKMSVPLRCDGGYSADNWAASGAETCGIVARKRDEGKFSDNFQEFLRSALAA